MKGNEFTEKYPDLAPTLMGYFDMSDLTDEEIAQEAVKLEDRPAVHRAKVIDSLVKESHKLLLDIDRDWDAFGDVANRPFRDAQQAREWLMRILAVWEKALREIDGGKPS
jgi:hypothetical protein